MSKYRSLKAEAWSLAALYLGDALAEQEPGLDPELVAHIFETVIPAMKRRAQIIERRSKA
jgi:hypothetical protein